MNKIIGKITEAREIDGARAADRFRFQADASLLKVLNIHQRNSNYRAFFDWIDDLIIVHDCITPNCIESYQIKGWEGNNCTPSKISEEIGALPPKSIVGRMYKNYQQFGEHLKICGLITNAKIHITLSSGRKSSTGDFLITGTMVHEDDWKTISNTIKEDCSTAPDEEYRKVFLIEKTKLGINDHRAAIYYFIEEEMKKRGELDGHSPIRGVSDTLILKVEDKIGTARKFSSYEEICEEKSLSATELEEFLAKASSAPNFDRCWPYIKEELMGIGKKGPFIEKMERNCQKYIYMRNKGCANYIKFSNASLDILKIYKVSGTLPETYLDTAKLLSNLKIEDLDIRDASDLSFSGAIVEAYEIFE
ncbi:dsDNA nuclease domain-containing protein [Azospirillum thiophilum]|uniref:dsDNA nuclease domain-containing protein n=1 Tax=Azospirillum thiophilum TaxID=528244 RepID=UPI0009E6192F|nr:dsDNA nuclease domain-containing protein [Azospirillum thiophilum]